VIGCGAAAAAAKACVAEVGRAATRHAARCWAGGNAAGVPFQHMLLAGRSVRDCIMPQGTAQHIVTGAGTRSPPSWQADAKNPASEAGTCRGWHALGGRAQERTHAHASARAHAHTGDLLTTPHGAAGQPRLEACKAGSASASLACSATPDLNGLKLHQVRAVNRYALEHSFSGVHAGINASTSPPTRVLVWTSGM